MYFRRIKLLVLFCKFIVLKRKVCIRVMKTTLPTLIRLYVKSVLSSIESIDVGITKNQKLDCSKFYKVLFQILVNTLLQTFCSIMFKTLKMVRTCRLKFKQIC